MVQSVFGRKQQRQIIEFSDLLGGVIAAFFHRAAQLIDDPDSAAVIRLVHLQIIKSSVAIDCPSEVTNDPPDLFGRKFGLDAPCHKDTAVEVVIAVAFLWLTTPFFHNAPPQ